MQSCAAPKVRGRCLVLGAKAMTPQVAANLKLHEDGPLARPVHQRRFAPARPRPAALPPRVAPTATMDAGASAALISREAIHRRLLGAADIMAATFALLLALTQYHTHNVAPAVVAGVLLVVLLFKMSGLYDRDDLRLVHTTLDEAPLLLQLTGLFALGVAVLQSVALTSSLHAEQIAGLWLVAFGSIFVGRVAARALAGLTSPIERCLVIGENSRVEQIRQKLTASRARALVVASLPIVSEHIQEMDWVDMPKLLRRVVQNLNVHRIILAPTTTDTTDVVNLIRSAKAVGVRVSVLPRMFEVVGSAVEFDDIDGMTMLGVRRRSRPDAAPHRPDLPGHRRGHPRGVPRTDVLPPGAGGTRRRAFLDLQVPLDGGRRRGTQG
jgi:hypothetical protein